MCTKANRTHGLLRRNRHGVKEMAYKLLVRPVLENACSGQNHKVCDWKLLMFVTGNCSYETGIMTDILEKLMCESLNIEERYVYIAIHRPEGLHG